MMYSNRSEHSHRRQHADKSSRQSDGYDDRWEGRHEPPRDVQRDPYHKYGGDRRRSREYSDSPKRLYSKDSLNRDRSKKSPLRRRMSSPDWGASEKKRQRVTEDGEDDYSYRREAENKTNRQSPDGFSHAYATKDFKHTLPQDEEIKYRKTLKDSRHRYRHKDFTHRQQQHDDSNCRRSFGYSRDRDGCERSRDFSQERTRSQDCSAKSYANPRERNDSPSTDHEDHCHTRTRFSLNGSSAQSFESDVTSQCAAVPEQKKSTKGFQRFLDVLNKGVNVAMLTKIVTQTSAEGSDHRPHSPAAFTSTADCLWSPAHAGRQQESLQNASHWSESKGPQGPASPQPPHRSFSPKGRSVSDEKPLQRGDGEPSHLGSNSRSGSPSAVEKMPLTPEDEHKHRQMQDVLQAIGMNLGFEELGQMSHRIQERLYGKKDADCGRHLRGSGERDARRAPSPRPQSRSSLSSRSSSSPSTREYYTKPEPYSAERDAAEAHRAVEYSQNSSSRSNGALQGSKKCETNSCESAATRQAFSQNPTYALSEPSPAPAMPAYPPVNCVPLQYQAPPPNLPHAGPGIFLAPYIPHPCTPPLNIFPAVLAQTRHLLPQHATNPPPRFFNPPDVNPFQPLNNTQKSKTVSRPRCLQVIETKQPG